MDTLIIYDDTGYIISQMSGSVREPKGGIQFMWMKIPPNKTLVGVDTSEKPNEPIFEDKQLTETELLKQQVQQQNQAISDLTMMITITQTPLP